MDTSQPTISGYIGIGLTVTAAGGTWDGNPQAFGYAWQRCDASGANCTPINGASSANYTIAGADSGSSLAVVVTAANADGSSSATSAAPE